MNRLRVAANLLFLSIALAVAGLAADEPYARYQEPALFSYTELIALQQNVELDERLDQKLTALRTTPSIHA